MSISRTIHLPADMQGKRLTEIQRFCTKRPEIETRDAFMYGS